MLQCCTCELVAALHKKRNGASTVDFATSIQVRVDHAGRVASERTFGPAERNRSAPEPIKPPRSKPAEPTEPPVKDPQPFKDPVSPLRPMQDPMPPDGDRPRRKRIARYKRLMKSNVRNGSSDGRSVPDMSALTPIADIGWRHCHVRLVPGAAYCSNVRQYIQEPSKRIANVKASYVPARSAAAAHGPTTRSARPKVNEPNRTTASSKPCLSSPDARAWAGSPNMPR